MDKNSKCIENYSLLNCLVDRNLIEKFIKEPECYRSREKAMGFMWDGSCNVLLKNGYILEFSMWQHYHNDNGHDWKPIGDELYKGFSPKFLYSPNGDTGVDAYWHLIYMGNYICYFPEGFFGTKIDKHQVPSLINDNTFIENKDYFIIYDERT